MSPLSATTPGITEPVRDPRLYWMRWALAFSLILHTGAALVIIAASGTNTDRNSTAGLIIQDITFTQPVAAPAIIQKAPEAARPSPEPPSPTTAPTSESSSQKPDPEQASNLSVNSGNGELASTPLGLGMTHGFFSGLADGRTLREDIRNYYFELVEKINREWWDSASLLKEPLRRDGIFELSIQPDGTIQTVRILQGTGSRETDQLVLEIVSNASPLPPLPQSYDRGLFRAPLRIKAPSILFRLTN